MQTFRKALFSRRGAEAQRKTWPGSLRDCWGEQLDLLIAAITLARGASLVTGNLRRYARIDGLRLKKWIRGDE